ncbi:hypothetical protein ABZ261_29440, partial [Streptomyces sp. NPDC006193]
LVAPGLPTFWFTLIVALPVSVLGARLFSVMFEMPFKRAPAAPGDTPPNGASEGDRLMRS